MAQLDSVANILEAWYRLVGSIPTDFALTELGEAEDEVGYIYLTQGSHDAQLYMLDNGYKGWCQRSDALSWEGTDATTGGKYDDLPADFLRADGNQDRSALVQTNGDRWGTQIETENDTAKGNYYYFKGDEIWLARTASPPTTLYLKYHYAHPEWESDTTIDFPMRARSLVVAEAANAAKEENWFVGDHTMEAKIREAVLLAQKRARLCARQTKQPRRFRKQKVLGRW